MKIFYTADTHLDHCFLQDLANKAIREKAALLHGGDFLDIYECGRYPIEVQIEHCTKLITTIQKHAAFFYTQGNHDIDNRTKNPNWITWDHGTIHTPDFVLTILKYNDPSNFEIATSGASHGTTLPWIILCHEPPAGSLTAGTGGSNLHRRIIEKFQPNYFLCGHHHNAPFSKTGSSTDKIGITNVLNPGKKYNGRPNYFEITEENVKWYKTKINTKL